MKEGIEYFSQSQRDELAEEIKIQRRQRDETRKRAFVAESRPWKDVVNNFLENEFGSDSLHKKADQLNWKTRSILKQAERRNTRQDRFEVGSEDELRNLLSDAERFPGPESIEIMRVYQEVKTHFEEIEAVRIRYSDIEPGGFILDNSVEWGDRSGWGPASCDLGLSSQERMALGDQGTIFFHCHPTKDGLDYFQIDPSSGDYFVIPYSRAEVIFSQAGVVLAMATQRNSFEETEKIYKELWEEACTAEEDSGWEMVGLVKKKFKIKYFVVDYKKISKAPD